ncbi:succinate dehydrogenase [Candidatus Sumerlaeota bacterium]|nr:succinate dehydrogenase [Candidatus Sumerlaeota bacterium]
MATSHCCKDIIERSFGATLRRDNWWVEPLTMVVVLLGFVIYSVWRAFEHANYWGGPYLSPFYSPHFSVDLPRWCSPAFLIIWVPAGFRFTCYYFRKAYYRSFASQPIACGVGKPWKSYSGESKLLLFQNLHRFFLYLAIAFIVVHIYDLVKATRWPVSAAAAYTSPHHAAGPTEFGIGIGTIVILIDVILLTGYVSGCHAFRHLVGGCIDAPSRVFLGRLRHRIWRGVNVFNEHHNMWGWISLAWVGFTDFYIRMVASGTISLEFDRLF